MSNIQELKPINKVQNIINKFCYTIGMLPTDYKISMTYEEQLIAIGNYLETTVIPSLNNNAEAVVELQNLYIELKNFVDNYFDDLDVTQEINNKIDSLVSNGTMSNLLEPICEDYFQELSNEIDELSEKHIMCVIGDSWSIPNYPYIESQSKIWHSLLANLLNLTVKNYAKSGAGYTRETNSFDTQVQNLINANLDKSKIDYIFILGGINDLDLGTPATLQNAAISLFNTLKTNFPNSKIIAIGCNTQYKIHAGKLNPDYNNQLITRYIEQATKFAGVGFIDIMPALLATNAFNTYTDQYVPHPNETGMSFLASYIFSALNGTPSHLFSIYHEYQENLPNNTTYVFNKDDENNPDMYLNFQIVNNKILAYFKLMNVTSVEEKTTYTYTLPDLKFNICQFIPFGNTANDICGYINITQTDINLMKNKFSVTLYPQKSGIMNAQTEVII